jgi:hypothetical protein
MGCEVPFYVSLFARTILGGGIVGSAEYCSGVDLDIQRTAGHSAW